MRHSEGFENRIAVIDAAVPAAIYRFGHQASTFSGTQFRGPVSSKSENFRGGQSGREVRHSAPLRAWSIMAVKGAA